MQVIHCNSFEDDRFKTISEFKDCMIRGGEVEFFWKGIHYCVFGKLRKNYESPEQMLVCLAGDLTEEEGKEMWCDTADDLLEYRVGGDRLRDVITQVKVWARTL